MFNLKDASSLTLIVWTSELLAAKSLDYTFLMLILSPNQHMNYDLGASYRLSVVMKNPVVVFRIAMRWL